MHGIGDAGNVGQRGEPLMSEEQKDDMMNKLLTGAVICLLSWNIYTTHQLSIDVAVLSEKIEQMEKKI